MKRTFSLLTRMEKISAHLLKKHTDTTERNYLTFEIPWPVEHADTYKHTSVACKRSMVNRSRLTTF